MGDGRYDAANNDNGSLSNGSGSRSGNMGSNPGS
jgi:hypothetical protein